MQLRYRRIRDTVVPNYTVTRENGSTSWVENLRDNVERLAFPTFALVGQLLTLSSAVHPTSGVAGLREKEAVALRNNLEMTLAGLGRGSRRKLPFILLEDLERCVNAVLREEA